MIPRYENHPSNIEEQIDRTLHLIGSADPRPGIEKRIAARLAARIVEAPVGGHVRIFGLPRVAFASVAGALASVAIIVGSVNHSHRILPVAPGVQLPVDASSGIGAASAAHVAPKPITPPATGHARSTRKTGASRATVPPDAQKPAGVAVPRSPLPQ